MKISSAFPSKYLKASDLNGRDVHVKINEVCLDLLEGSNEEKPVCSFIGKKKALVLNQTNATALATAYGDDTEDWHGRPVVLFAATTSFNGRVVPCIRCRVPRPASPPAPAPQPAPQEPQDAGFDDAEMGDCPF